MLKTQLPDAKTGLGYGLTKSSGRNALRASGDIYPYVKGPTYDEIDDEEFYLDDDVENAIRNKTLGKIMTTDFFAASKSNPFFFVAGNTKLSESSAKNSLVPFPKMYKNAIFPGNPSYLKSLGPTHGFSSTSQKTSGSKRGNSKAFKTVTQSLVDYFDDFETDEDYLNALEMTNDELHVYAIRKFTDLISANNHFSSYSK
jgi:hypothetical protein